MNQRMQIVPETLFDVAPRQSATPSQAT